jgi:hypothetical protein
MKKVLRIVNKKQAVSNNLAKGVQSIEFLILITLGFLIINKGCLIARFVRILWLSPPWIFAGV